jgi:transposase
MIKQLREKGVRIVDIADELRCSERTVRRKLQQDKPSTGRRKPRGSKLDRYKTDINTMLYAENIWNAEVIFRRLKQQGYAGGISLLRNYITPLRVAVASRQTVRFETKPGAQLQHDWGQLSAIVADKRCTVNIAVNCNPPILIGSY